MAVLDPGIFKIINAESDTAMTVSDGNDGRVFCWERHDGLTQKWLVQPSGSGWRIKNYRTGEYLTVSNTDNVSEVYCGRYPISWELAQGPEDHDTCMIKFAGCDRIFHLHDCDAIRNGNKVYLCRQLDRSLHQKWRFERLGSNTGDEAQLLSRETAVKDRWLAEKDRQLADKNRELADKNRQLADERRQLLEMAGRLAIQGREIERVEADRQRIRDQLVEVTERLAARDRESGRLRRNDPNDTTRDDIELLRVEIQTLREGLENETSGRRRETAELHEKITNLESLLAQVQAKSRDDATQ